MEYRITDDNVLIIEEGDWRQINTIPKSAFHTADYGYSRAIYRHDTKFDNIVKIVVPDSISEIDDGVFERFPNLEEIELPEGLKSISNNMFYECPKLKSITLPSTIETIGENAFSKCTSLESIVIPAGCKKISSDAFYACEMLKKIEFAEGIEISPEFYFARSYGTENIHFQYVEEAVLHEGLKEIRDNIFKGSKFLKRIELPNSLEKMGEGSFQECESLETITIPPQIKTIPKLAFEGCNSLKTITIPEGVETIEAGAFSWCSGLEEIELPSSVREISSLLEKAFDRYIPTLDYSKKKGAFENCKKLRRIVIPEGVEEIDSNTFLGCESLEEIILPSTIKRIKDGAFKGCKKLKKIVLPNGLEEIGYGAFSECESLTEISIPDSVTSLGYNCFEHCTSLDEVRLSDQINVVPEECFSGCSSLRTINIPNSASGIRMNAFKDCISLQQIDIPDSVTEISDSSFENCKNLKRVRMSQTIKNIGYQAFKDCTSLEEIEFPESLEFEHNAFEGCPKDIIKKIPSRLKCVEPGVITAFSREDVCDGVLIIPEGVKIIRSLDFLDRGSRSKASSAVKYSSLNITEIKLPDGLLEIEDEAIVGFSDLEKVIMPDSVTRIGENNFEYCFHLEQVRLSRALEKLPDSVFEALQNSRVACIVIPDSATYIPRNSTEPRFIESDSARDKISYMGAKNDFHDGLSFRTKKEDTAFFHYSVKTDEIIKSASSCLVSKYPAETRDKKEIKKSSKKQTMATYKDLDEITFLTVKVENGKIIAPFALSQCPNLETVIIEDGVEEIGPGAFAECTKLKSVIIPNSVKKIGEFAFYGCSSLERITAPENEQIGGKSMAEIGDFAFAECSSLSEISLPKRVGRIGTAAFCGCTELIKVDGIEDVDTIDDYAFAACEKLHIRIPSKVREIGFFAFASAGKKCHEDGKLEMPIVLPRELRNLAPNAFYCSGITRVELAQGIRIDSIPRKCFCGCEYLEDLVLSSGLQTIADEAFRGCKFLDELEIPASVSEIGEYAFADCEKMSSVSLYNTEKREGLHKPTTFQGCPLQEPFYGYDGVIKPQAETKRRRFGFKGIREIIASLSNIK